MNRFFTLSAVILLFIIPVVILGFASADAETGKAVYMKRCKMCHGADGNGNPAMARMLGVEFKSMSSSEVQALDDETISQIIKKGKGKMAKVRKTNDEEIAHVIVYLRSLK